MEAIPLHRIAIVLPFVNFLSEIGAPVERGIRQAGLPVSALDNANNHVPSQRFWAFAGSMAHSEGIEDLGYRVGEKYGANCANPHLASLLCQAPTLYDALVQASNLINRSTSRGHTGLYTRPNSEQVLFIHRPSFSANHPYISQIDWFGIMAQLGMVRLFTGPQWLPDEICTTVRHEPCDYIQQQLAGTRIRIAQPCSFIALDSNQLGLPPLSQSKAIPPSIQLDALPSDFATSLRQALGAYIQESDLSIEFAAELCNTSKRSLQRMLSAAGTSYSEVIDRALFDVASDLLQNTDMRITELSHQLGYCDSSHFSRAFRRVSGISPRKYRQLYSH